MNKLRYKYCHVGKNVFINGHKTLDVIKNRKYFLQEIKELEPYLVEFDKTGQMILKVYPSDCEVRGDKRQPIIVIIYDKCTFSFNDGPCFRWQKDGDTFLQPKNKGRGIMVSEFLLFFGWLNLSFLSELNQQDLIERCGLRETEAVEIFEFGKNNQGYWTGANLLKQVKNKALSIAQALYPGYSLLFLFDNATSHSVYKQNALQIKNMSKGPSKKQAFLRNGWFEREWVWQN